MIVYLYEAFIFKDIAMETLPLFDFQARNI